MAKKKRYNPERKEFKGRSHKKGGTRVKKLVYGEFVLDWKDMVTVGDLRAALSPFGLEVIEHPMCEGSDSYGFIISNRELTKEELEDASRMV